MCWWNIIFRGCMVVMWCHMTTEHGFRSSIAHIMIIVLADGNLKAQVSPNTFVFWFCSACNDVGKSSWKINVDLLRLSANLAFLDSLSVSWRCLPFWKWTRHQVHHMPLTRSPMTRPGDRLPVLTKEPCWICQSITRSSIYPHPTISVGCACSWLGSGPWWWWSTWFTYPGAKYYIAKTPLHPDQQFCHFSTNGDRFSDSQT